MTGDQQGGLPQDRRAADQAAEGFGGEDEAEAESHQREEVDRLQEEVGQERIRRPLRRGGHVRLALRAFAGGVEAPQPQRQHQRRTDSDRGHDVVRRGGRDEQRVGPA